MNSNSNKMKSDDYDKNEIDFGSDDVVVVDLTKKIISFSEEAERILNFQMDEVTDQTLYEIFGEEIKQLDSAFTDTIKQGNIHSNLVVSLFENRRFSYY